jgi:hypothetical protein
MCDRDLKHNFGQEELSRMRVGESSVGSSHLEELQKVETELC